MQRSSTEPLTRGTGHILTSKFTRNDAPELCVYTMEPCRLGAHPDSSAQADEVCPFTMELVGMCSQWSKADPN